jgi:hypothetical protein
MSKDKLKFPLCRTCADTENQNDCSCNDEKITMTGTWCNPEIELACSMGYKIVKIYEVYHFEESSMYDRFWGEIWTTSQHEAVVVPLRTRGRQVFSVTHGYEKRDKGHSRDQRSHNTNGIFGQFVFLTHRF